MASEVTSGLIIELSDLNYPCSHVYLASKGLHETNQTDRQTDRGDLSSIDERWLRPLVKSCSQLKPQTVSLKPQTVSLQPRAKIVASKTLLFKFRW